MGALQPRDAELFDSLRAAERADLPKVVRDLQEAGLRRSSDPRERGSAIHAAETPVPADMLMWLLDALGDERWEVRRDAALAVGAWCGETAMPRLNDLVRDEPEWRVRLAVVDALARIGGPGAVRLLVFIARTDPHPHPAVRACNALADLAVAAWPEDFVPERLHVSSFSGGHGAPVRVRGVGPVRRLDPAAEAILLELEEIRRSHRDAAVRAAAEQSLANLGR